MSNLFQLADAAATAVRLKIEVLFDGDASVFAMHDENTFEALFKDHPSEEAAYCWAVYKVAAQMEGKK